MSAPQLAELPLPLAAAAKAALERFGGHDASSPEAALELATVLGTSEFVAAVAARQNEWFAGFLAERRYEQGFDADQLASMLDEQLVDIPDEQGLMTLLRRVRNQIMVQLVWRDLTRRADFEETTAAVSALADTLVDAALSCLYGWAVEKSGAPRGETGGQRQRLSVLALGKLGGGELNLSSDIDLVFVYDEAGSTDGGAQSNQQFFTRLAQRLIHVLDATTPDGFVFRVDMRLRPYGDSGALVYSAIVAEQYYEQQGRDWERYAWIRARAVAGDVAAGQRLLEALRPFVYRRYLDFGAIDALRDMKARIDAERRKGSMACDVKLGPGGIREVEFIVQVLQLIWGGRQGELRLRRTLAALQSLVSLGHVPAETGEALARAYVFLRDVEHKIQALRDQQTQKLPESDLDQARLAHAMGYENYPAFLIALDEHRSRVAVEFDAVIEAGPQTSDRWRRVWASADELSDSLAAADIEPAAELAARLAALKAQSERVSVDPAGRARLDALMPALLAEVSRSEVAGTALSRVLPLLEAVMRRSAYYVLLSENTNALKQLVDLCGASRWLAAELARHPALLDELLDERHLFQVPDRDGLREDLAHRLAGVDDPEAVLEALRGFKQGHEFRVAACELKGILPLMKISDYLTYIAEVILEQALDLAWSATLETSKGPSEKAFLIVGYGKLGGLELGPGSDLDMVFLHDLDAQHSQFVNRMIRRLLNVLTTRTHSGALYEVDMRLRPSGRSGAVVSSLNAFEQYQRREAWVWEHQALVRARPVAGDPALAARFDELRQRLLCETRDVAALKTSVIEMRERIQRQAGAADLKRGAGGIVDIEFMVQYLVLAWAAEHPSLAVYTDNVRILEAAADVGLLTDERAAALKQAYLALRAERHRAALDIADDARAQKVLDAHRSAVRQCWDELLGEP